MSATQAFVRAGLTLDLPNCWSVQRAPSTSQPRTLIAMAPKRKLTKKQQPITELALPLLKKPLEHDRQADQ